MSTITVGRCETRSITIPTTPDRVLDYLADADNLPQWAPNFARAVRRDTDKFIVDTDNGELSMRLRVSHEHGTVDLLAAANPRRGAFMRVLPNVRGSEFLFTLVFKPGTSDEAVERQMTIVEEELETVRSAVAPQE